VAGDLTVGLMPSVANSVLPAVLADKTSYPDVTLRIVEAYSGSLIDQLFSGKLDLAVVNNSSDLCRAAIAPLFRDYLVLVSRYKRAKRVPAEIQSSRLHEFKLVLPSQRQGMRLLIDSMLASKGISWHPHHFTKLMQCGFRLGRKRRENVAQVDCVISVPIEVGAGR
jgi:LysR family transcriptional regulator, nitrogen assimilation regulatory protein